SDAPGIPDGRDLTGSGTAAPTSTAAATAAPTDTAIATATDAAAAGPPDTVMVPPGRRIGLALAAPSLVLAAVTLTLGLGGQLLLELSGTAAANLYDPTGYVQAVLG
ncbi:MAG: monovalent cation/H+ antiporter subunit D family protein, partial [Dietzia cercidiphylli]